MKEGASEQWCALDTTVLLRSDKTQYLGGTAKTAHQWGGASWPTVPVAGADYAYPRHSTG